MSTAISPTCCWAFVVLFVCPDGKLSEQELLSREKFFILLSAKKSCLAVMLFIFLLSARTKQSG
jgi:hypothetical protein